MFMHMRLFPAEKQKQEKKEHTNRIKMDKNIYKTKKKIDIKQN